MLFSESDITSLSAKNILCKAIQSNRVFPCFPGQQFLLHALLGGVGLAAPLLQRPKLRIPVRSHLDNGGCFGNRRTRGCRLDEALHERTSQRPPFRGPTWLIRPDLTSFAPAHSTALTDSAGPAS